jgi:hypothetical protein
MKRSENTGKIHDRGHRQVGRGERSPHDEDARQGAEAVPLQSSTLNYVVGLLNNQHCWLSALPVAKQLLKVIIGFTLKSLHEQYLATSELFLAMSLLLDRALPRP